MATGSRAARRVRIYIRSRAPAPESRERLSSAILRLLRREGAAGATVLRGVAGYADATRLRSPSAADPFADSPLVVEWIDEPIVVERLLPRVQSMVEEGTITVQDIEVL